MVVESRDGLESQQEEVGKIQGVHGDRSAQEFSMGARREGKDEYVRYDGTGEAPRAVDGSGDDDDVIGFVGGSGSDEDNVSVVAMLDAEILAADEELSSLVKNLAKEPEEQWQSVYL